MVKADGSFVFPEDEDTASFITSNVVATFYHELGHALIDVLALPEWIDVSVANCGEANVFYHPEKRSITICNGYAKDLERIWKTQRQGVKEALNKQSFLCSRPAQQVRGFTPCSIQSPCDLRLD